MVLTMIMQKTWGGGIPERRAYNGKKRGHLVQGVAPRMSRQQHQQVAIDSFASKNSTEGP